jgi:hypothetical protein
MVRIISMLILLALTAGPPLSLKRLGGSFFEGSLKQAGEALWGPRYKSEMARQLDVHLRTVMRYDAGERMAPPQVLDQLYGLLIKRQADIRKLVGKLSDARREAA